jgi:hypothetical protein
MMLSAGAGIEKEGLSCCKDWNPELTELEEGRFLLLPLFLLSELPPLLPTA